MIAIDTNVLVYAHRGETELHKTALDQLSSLCTRPEPWGLPVTCIGEFFRVVTHPRVFNPPSKLEDAMQFMQALIEAPSCRMLRPGQNFTKLFFDVMSESNIKGNLVFDAQIVALCREHGATEVLTNDRDFERFSSIKVAYL